jgi:hypothetical protein
VFRRSSIAAIGGFREEIGPAADYAVYLTFARAGTVSFDAREVVRYRYHDAAMSCDPVLMLDAVLRVLRRERPHVPPECFAAFKAGGREWRSFYGEQIIERLWRDWLARRQDRWQILAAHHSPGTRPGTCTIFTPSLSSDCSRGGPLGPKRRTRRRDCHSAQGPTR